MKETSLTEEQKPCWTVLLMEAILTAAIRTKPHQWVAQWRLVQLSFWSFCRSFVWDYCHLWEHFRSCDLSLLSVQQFRNEQRWSRADKAVLGLKPWNHAKGTHCTISSTWHGCLWWETVYLYCIFCCLMKYAGWHVTPCFFTHHYRNFNNRATSMLIHHVKVNVTLVSLGLFDKFMFILYY